MAVDVDFTPDAREAVFRLRTVIRTRMLALVERLRRWPAVSGAKPLRGKLAGWYRLRTGDYRLRFRVQGQLIIIDQVGHRKDFYDD